MQQDRTEQRGSSRTREQDREQDRESDRYRQGAGGEGNCESHSSGSRSILKVKLV